MSVASESKVQRPPDTPELTQLVKAAAQTRETSMTIDAQIQGNVHTEQTNVAAGDGSISTR